MIAVINVDPCHGDPEVRLLQDTEENQRLVRRALEEIKNSSEFTWLSKLEEKLEYAEPMTYEELGLYKCTHVACVKFYF